MLFIKRQKPHHVHTAFLTSRSHQSHVARLVLFTHHTSRSQLLSQFLFASHFHARPFVQMSSRCIGVKNYGLGSHTRHRKCKSKVEVSTCSEEQLLWQKALMFQPADLAKPERSARLCMECEYPRAILHAIEKARVQKIT